jgi:hypothetical protein
MESIGLPAELGDVTRLLKRALRTGRLDPGLGLAECSVCGAARLGPTPPTRCPTCGWQLVRVDSGDPP